MSVTAEELKSKILEFYPEVGKNKVDLSVDFDEAKKAWIVKLHHQGNDMMTHVEEADAENCLKGVECVYLGTQIGQFITTHCGTATPGGCPV